MMTFYVLIFINFIWFEGCDTNFVCGYIIVKTNSETEIRILSSQQFFCFNSTKIYFILNVGLRFVSCRDGRSPASGAQHTLQPIPDMISSLRVRQSGCLVMGLILLSHWSPGTMKSSDWSTRLLMGVSLCLQVAVAVLPVFRQIFC